MDIYYINSAGDKLDLLSDKIAIQNIETLFDNEWSYQSATSMIFGGKVKKFYKGVQEKELTVSIVADNEEDFTELSKEIEDVLFYDVHMMQPGRLYVNDTYLSCYFFSSVYEEYEDLFYITDRKFKIVTEYPKWIAERYYQINRSISMQNAVAGFMLTGSAVLNRSSVVDSKEDDMESAYVSNPLRIPCDFKIKINGPSEWPFLKIGDNIYNIDEEIPEGSYLEIDAIKKTCILYDNSGNSRNVFGYRNPDYYIFEKIKPGINSVEWSDSTLLEFTIYEERGEPLWS